VNRIGEAIAHKIFPGAEILHPLPLLWTVSNTEIKLTEILEFEPDSNPLEQSSLVYAVQRCEDGEMGGFHICFESLCEEWSLFRRVSPLYKDLLAATVIHSFSPWPSKSLNIVFTHFCVNMHWNVVYCNSI
jgi:hypothetical protein